MEILKRFILNLCMPKQTEKQEIIKSICESVEADDLIFDEAINMIQNFDPDNPCKITSKSTQVSRIIR